MAKRKRRKAKQEPETTPKGPAQRAVEYVTTLETLAAKEFAARAYESMKRKGVVAVDRACVGHDRLTADEAQSIAATIRGLFDVD